MTKYDKPQLLAILMKALSTQTIQPSRLVVTEHACKVLPYPVSYLLLLSLIRLQQTLLLLGINNIIDMSQHITSLVNPSLITLLLLLGLLSTIVVWEQARVLVIRVEADRLLVIVQSSVVVDIWIPSAVAHDHGAADLRKCGERVELLFHERMLSEFVVAVAFIAVGLFARKSVNPGSSPHQSSRFSAQVPERMVTHGDEYKTKLMRLQRLWWFPGPGDRKMRGEPLPCVCDVACGWLGTGVEDDDGLADRFGREVEVARHLDGVFRVFR